MYATADRQTRRHHVNKKCARCGVYQQQSLWSRRILLSLIRENEDDVLLAERLRVVFSVLESDNPRFHLQKQCLKGKSDK